MVKFYKFELCPFGSEVIVPDGADKPRNWRGAKKLFKSKGYKGNYLLLEHCFDGNGNTVVHKVTL